MSIITKSSITATLIIIVGFLHKVISMMQTKKKMAHKVAITIKAEVVKVFNSPTLGIAFIGVKVIVLTGIVRVLVTVLVTIFISAVILLLANILFNTVFSNPNVTSN